MGKIWKKKTRMMWEIWGWILKKTRRVKQSRQRTKAKARSLELVLIETFGLKKTKRWQ